jgi:hypothetical protein
MKKRQGVVRGFETVEVEVSNDRLLWIFQSKESICIPVEFLNRLISELQELKNG